ncbi:hypothetical protein V8E51_011230 [Hyaloscypha variabilis]
MCITSLIFPSFNVSLLSSAVIQALIRTATIIQSLTPLLPSPPPKTMVSTRANPTSPLFSPLRPPTIRRRPRLPPRPPLYSPGLSAAVIADLLDDEIDIGPKATPVTNISSHVERRIGGQVVYLTRKEDEERRKKERARRLARERKGGKGRAARRRAWKRGGGLGRSRGAGGKFE